ncbi:MAG: hypothetical protein JST89_14020 [Cyanobacteria bacterium SZAS-4]|nr:hypothetical protein [Cyanobacteria bacterium SZAS-4]
MSTESQTDFAQIAESARIGLQNLTSLVAEFSQPKGDMFFAEIDYAVRMIQRIEIILRRMSSVSNHARELRIKLWDYLPTDDSNTVSEFVSQLYTELSDTTFVLEMDFESLYRNGTVLLDQLAAISGRIAGLQKRCTYSRMIEKFFSTNEFSTAIQPLWSAHRKELLAHYGGFKLFRDKFLDHHEIAFTAGVAASVRGYDFRLCRFSYPAMTAVEQEKIQQDILPITSKCSQSLRDRISPESGVSLFRILLENLDEFNLDEIRHIEKMASKYGLESPSFEKVGTDILKLTTNTSAILCSIAKNNLDRIRLN